MTPLLIPQGRRDLAKGAKRAVKWLAGMPADTRTDEWRWLIDGENTPTQIYARRAPSGGGWDTYSIGRLYPGVLTVSPITAWLPVLACHGAGLLNTGRQQWHMLRTQHPDAFNIFQCICPRRWVTASEVARWYLMAASATQYELRPIAGEMNSYCKI